DMSQVLEEVGRLPVETALDFLLQACEALAEAHALGMVHRDLKPANLFLSHRADGTACIKVLDFGISKLADEGGSEGGGFSMTKTNVVMGSPQYMSPEQMRSARNVDARSDIWALGIILFELLAGTPPFNAETIPDLCIRIIQDSVPFISQQRTDVPRGLDA